MANADSDHVLVSDNWTESDHEAALSAFTAESREEPEHARHGTRFNYVKILLMISLVAILGALAMNRKHLPTLSAGVDLTVGLVTDVEFGNMLSNRTAGRHWGEVASAYNSVAGESHTSPDQTLAALNAHISTAATREELLDSMRMSAQLALSNGNGASPGMFDPILLSAPASSVPTTGPCGGVTCDPSETCVQNRCKCGDNVLMCASDERCSGQPPACRLLSMPQSVQTTMARTTLVPSTMASTTLVPIITTTTAMTSAQSLDSVGDSTLQETSTTVADNTLQDLFDGVAGDFT